MAGDVEREEGGRNGRSDEENKAGCYQLSIQQVKAVFFYCLEQQQTQVPTGKGCRASLQHTGVSDNTECVTCTHTDRSTSVSASAGVFLVMAVLIRSMMSLLSLG